MQYYRCKCGKREAWSSMGVTQCQGCPECGTNLTQHPDDHKDPLPHDYSSHIEQMGPAGPIQVPVCRYCHKTQWEIEGQKGEGDLDGVDFIRQERARQIEEEGWDSEHDDEHEDGELALAGACYAIPADHRKREVGYEWAFMVADLVCALWPWWEHPVRGRPFKNWWKPSPTDRIRELTKAGALIAAEIDRLKRAEAKEEAPSHG